MLGEVILGVCTGGTSWTDSSGSNGKGEVAPTKGIAIVCIEQPLTVPQIGHVRGISQVGMNEDRVFQKRVNFVFHRMPIGTLIWCEGGLLSPHRFDCR